MLWEMSAVKACVRCVGVLALVLGLMLRFMPHEAAGMYRKHQAKLLLRLFPLLLFFLSHYYSFFISLLLVFMFSDCALSFHRPQAGLLDRNKRLMCLFMWLPTSQNKILAKEKLGTMETA